MTATVTRISDRRAPYRIREGCVDDVRFVVSTWIRSAEKPRHVPIDAWFDNLRRLAAHHVSTGRVVIACSPTSEATILGWACAAGDAVAHVFVRYDLRGRGMGRALCDALRKGDG